VLLHLAERAGRKLAFEVIRDHLDELLTRHLVGADAEIAGR
jgi:hypothetical protein